MEFTDKDKEIVATNRDLPPSRRTIAPSVDRLATTLNLMASGAGALANFKPRDRDKPEPNFTTAEYIALQLKP